MPDPISMFTKLASGPMGSGPMALPLKMAGGLAHGIMGGIQGAFGAQQAAPASSQQQQPSLGRQIGHDAARYVAGRGFRSAVDAGFNRWGGGGGAAAQGAAEGAGAAATGVEAGASAAAGAAGAAEGVAAAAEVLPLLAL